MAQNSITAEDIINQLATLAEFSSLSTNAKIQILDSACRQTAKYYVNSDKKFYQVNTLEVASIVSPFIAFPDQAGNSGKFLSTDGSDLSWEAVTKSSIGLGNIDNTSDANKPISTATQTALNLKLDTSTKPPDYLLTGSGTTTSASDGSIQTRYIGVFWSAIGTSADTAALAWKARKNGTLKNLTATVNISASSVVIVTVMINGSASVLTATVTASGLSYCEDITHTLTITKGDRIEFRCSVERSGGTASTKSCDWKIAAEFYS